MMKKYLISLLSFVLLVGALSTKANDNYEYEEGELAQILAPIALYPDSVLTHILIASTYPLEVIEANRWLNKGKNRKLSPAKAMDKVEDKTWDPSIKALIPFPKVIERMSDNLSWTQQLGDAFLQNEEEVLDTIQTLRERADKAGNLKKMDNVKVVREKRIIVLEPREPEVVYIPYYDTRYVYGNWRWAHYPPIYWRNRYYDYHASPFYWHPRVHISFNYFHSAFHWHNHHVVRFHGRYYDRPRHYFQRHDIIRHTNVRRWEHNPVHRRGVAYRTNVVKQRFNSHRPSRIQTQNIRRVEREQRITTRTTTDRKINKNTRVRNVDTTRQVTRQQRVKRSLDKRVERKNTTNGDFNRKVVRSKTTTTQSKTTQNYKHKNNGLNKSYGDRSNRTVRNHNTRSFESRENVHNEKTVIKRNPSTRQDSRSQPTRQVQRSREFQRKQVEKSSRSNFNRPTRQNSERRNIRRQNRSNSSRRVEP